MGALDRFQPRLGLVQRAEQPVALLARLGQSLLQLRQAFGAGLQHGDLSAQGLTVRKVAAGLTQLRATQDQRDSQTGGETQRQHEIGGKRIDRSPEGRALRAGTRRSPSRKVKRGAFSMV